MADTRSRWLIGCGVGCGLVVVALGVIAVAGYLYVSRYFAGVGQAERSHRELVSRYGEVQEFTPQPDGVIPRSRVELFLSVREELDEPRARLRAVLDDFPPDDVIEEDHALFVVLGMLRGIAGLIKPIAEYIDERNRVLLRTGMGLGEYVYIYSTAYYSWLGHSPEAGPVITKETGGRLQTGRDRRLFDDSDSPFNAEAVRRRYRRYMLSMMRNQLAALSGPESPAGSDVWRERLEAEIDRFESRPDRVAWGEGLPPRVEASLEPFRARFESAWDEATNPFEIPQSDAEGQGLRRSR